MAWLAAGLTEEERWGHSQQEWGHLATSAQSAGQEADLVCWGHFAEATLLGTEVNVLRSHGTGHREVLEDGGEEKEQFVAGNAFAKTNALSCGHRE